MGYMGFLLNVEWAFVSRGGGGTENRKLCVTQQPALGTASTFWLILHISTPSPLAVPQKKPGGCPGKPSRSNQGHIRRPRRAGRFHGRGLAHRVGDGHPQRGAEHPDALLALVAVEDIAQDAFLRLPAERVVVDLGQVERDFEGAVPQLEHILPRRHVAPQDAQDDIDSDDPATRREAQKIGRLRERLRSWGRVQNFLHRGLDERLYWTPLCEVVGRPVPVHLAPCDDLSRLHEFIARRGSFSCSSIFVVAFRIRLYLVAATFQLPEPEKAAAKFVQKPFVDALTLHLQALAMCAAVQRYVPRGRVLSFVLKVKFGAFKGSR